MGIFEEESVWVSFILDCCDTVQSTFSCDPDKSAFEILASPSTGNLPIRMSKTVIWSRSNIVFAAHPTLPQLHGQLIPPHPHSKPAHRFDLPLPAIVLANIPSFDPPTCLALSDDDAHLFAFFPPSSIMGMEDGVCCVWERENELNLWILKDFWRIERGNDVVTARWIENGRRVSCLWSCSDGSFI